jgi:radical SAM superfamily enzyme YgiQ (UPF0313 family)
MTDVLIFADNTKFISLTKNPNSRISIRSAGSYRIATEVRTKGLSCQVVEILTEFSLSELEIICKKFISNETLIIGFNTTFWFKNHEDLVIRINYIISYCRSINIKIKIVFGGPNALDLNKDYRYDIDAIILGFGEYNFINYLDSLINKKPLPFPSRTLGNIKIYEFVENFDKFQFCNSQIIYEKADCLIPGEPVIIEVGRGCIFKCKFCAYPLTGKKKLDYLKDPDVLREELIRNYEDHGLDKYIISDDTFNDNTEKLEYLYKIFTSLPFKIYFAAYIRLDLLNAHRKQINILHEMGLVGANFGIETFHEKAARTIGKGIVSEIAKQLLYDLQTKYWKDEIKIQINLITGLPYEPFQSLKETQNWILDEEQCLIDAVSTTPLMIRNTNISKNVWLSEFEKNAEKYGYYWKENDYRRWYNDVQPIKSFHEAVLIKQQMFDAAAVKSKRTMQGGFDIFSHYASRLFCSNKKTFEEQLKMNRYEFNEWLQMEDQHLYRKKFVDFYKQKILNL